jgi:hypothetical protein
MKNKIIKILLIYSIIAITGCSACLSVRNKIDYWHVNRLSKDTHFSLSIKTTVKTYFSTTLKVDDILAEKDKNDYFCEYLFIVVQYDNGQEKVIKIYDHELFRGSLYLPFDSWFLNEERTWIGIRKVTRFKVMGDLYSKLLGFILLGSELPQFSIDRIKVESDWI